MNEFVIIAALMLLAFGCICAYVWLDKKRVFSQRMYLNGRRVSDRELLAMTEEEISLLPIEDRNWLINYAAHHEGAEWIKLFERASRCKYPHRVHYL